MATIAAERPVRRAGARESTLTGTGRLLLFMLRRDRIRFSGWVLGLTLMMTYFVTALGALIKTPEDLEGFRSFASSPAGALFGGPGFGFDQITLERFLVGMYGLYLLLGAGLMGLLTVIRHTRAEERTGRAELVRANIVGRHAQLTAALLLTTIMGALVGVLITGVLVSQGWDAGGAMVYGASVTACTLAFAGIAALTAQLSPYPRAAAGMAGAALGVAFLLRALGDMSYVLGSGPSWLSWLSPIGWSQQVAPYTYNRWWPLALSLMFTVVTATVGYVLSARRDFGAGLIAPRAGSASARTWLRVPLALAFRLQRASIIGWSAGLFVAGLSYGAFTKQLTGSFESMPEEFVKLMGGAGHLLNGYLGLMGIFMALTVTVFAILAVQSLRGEETDGRTEPVLAAAVSRTAWTGSHLTVAAAAVPVLLLFAGVGMGLGSVASTGDAGLFWPNVAGHIAHTPAVWLVLAIAALLYGAAPRAVPAVWAILAYALIAGFFGPMLNIPARVIKLSPFEHIGDYPLESIDPVAMLALAALAALVSWAGLVAFRRRDLINTG